MNTHVQVSSEPIFNFSWLCVDTHTLKSEIGGSCGHCLWALYRMLIQKSFANFQVDYFIIKLLESFLCNLNTSSFDG